MQLARDICWPEAIDPIILMREFLDHKETEVLLILGVREEEGRYGPITRYFTQLLVIEGELLLGETSLDR